MTLPTSDDFATHELCASELDAISGGLGLGGITGGLIGGILGNLGGLLAHLPHPTTGGCHSPHPTHLPLPQLPPFIFPFL